MNDSNDLDDVVLDERLRSGLAAVVEAAGDPPPLDGNVPGPTSHLARRWVAVAAAVVVLMGVAAAVASRTGDDKRGEQIITGRTGTSEVAKPSRPLVDTRWALVSAERAGGSVETPAEQPIGLRFMTAEPTMYASDACNGASREYRVDGDTVVLGDRVGGSTMMACSGPLVTLLGDVFGADLLRYVIEGDQLELRAEDVDGVLTYRAVDGVFAPTTGTVVDHGEVGDAQYRLLREGEGLSLEVGDATTEMWAGGGGLGDDPGRINADRRAIRGQDYVYGIVPAAATRVVYEPMGGTAEELQIHQVGSKTSAVVGQFVDRGAAEWMLTAYDADDIELFRYRFGPSQDDKNGLWIEDLITRAGFQQCCRQVGARYEFSADGVAMSADGAPLVTWAPRDPTQGLSDGTVEAAPGGGTIAIGRVRDEVAVRFDCWLRYEIRAAPEHEALAVQAAQAMSEAQGCPELSIS